MSYISKLKNEDTDRLFKAILSLKSEEECYMFFEDICTISELTALINRLKVAFLLKSKHTCQDIANKTKVSTATISRVNRCINYGTGGYEMVIGRIEEDEK